MNILQILPELNVGGVETGTVDLAGYLVKNGHQSVVVSNGGALVPQLVAAGSKHYTLPVHRKNLWTAVRCIDQLVDIINKEKIDIVHARSRVPAWIAFFACRKTEAHFLTTCHGYYSTHFFSRVMGWGKLAIAISQAVGRHMAQDFGTPAQNIRVIPRSVDLEKFNVPRPAKTGKKSHTVVMVGRITPLKGHAYFLKAMSRVIHQMPSVKVQIIGEAPAKKQAYKDELVLLTKRLGIEASVEFMGNRRDIPQLLSKADCLVLSTVTPEAFGRVIIEAQAAGVPVVATRVGGTVEIIDDGKTGLLVLPKDVEAMAGAVVKVLANPESSARLVEEAKKKIHERYTLRHMAEATLEVYRELMQSTRILIIKMTAIGDVVLSTAAFKAIRAQFPQAHIVCLTSPQAAPLLEHGPWTNEAMMFDPKTKGWAAVWKQGGQLRRCHFDKVVDLQNNRTSHILSFLALAKESYGYDNGKCSFLLSRKIKNDARLISPVEHQFRVLKMLDIDYTPNVRLELNPSDKDKAYVRQLLEGEWFSDAQAFIGLNVSASPQWPTKNWPPEQMARLCDILGQKNIRVVLTGEEKARNLGRKLEALARAKPANLIGKTSILQLAALIGQCKAYVSPDSAPLHVAASQNVPIVALFGPTDAKRHMPPSDKNVVIQKTLKCAPCYSNVCKIKTHACMRDISAEEVARRLMPLIQ